jgi:hypothetical protein
MGSLFSRSKPEIASILDFDVVLIGCSVLAGRKKDGMVAKDCDKPGINPLKGVSDDLELMEKYFKSKKVKSISIIKPTGEKTTELLSSVHQNSGKLIVYYSGHGREMDGAWCIQNGESSTEYISPRDFFKGTESGWERMALFIPFLIGSRKFGLKSSDTIVITDSCFAGHWLGEFAADDKRLQNISIYASSESNQTSWCGDKGSVFTQALLSSNEPEVSDQIPRPRNQNPVYHAPKLYQDLKPFGVDKTVEFQRIEL